MKRQLIIGAAILSAAFLTTPGFCDSPAAPASSASTLTPGQEKQAAFEAVQRLRTAKTLPSVAQALTNNSAAQVSIVEIMGMSIIVAFQNVGNTKQSDTNFTNDLAAYLKSYGLTDSSMPTNDLESLPASFMARGRQALTGLQPFAKRAAKVSGAPSILPFAELAQDLSGYKMEIKGDDAVKITPQKFDSRMPPFFYARIEDGAWRIDLGDLTKLSGISSTSAQSSNHPQTPGPLADKLFDAVKNDQPAVVSSILNRKPSLVEARDDQGDTPLIAECFWGSLDVVKVLVAHHANVNDTDNTGSTGLMQAATFDKVDILEYLIQKGASLEAKDDMGYNALYYANQQKNADAAEILKQHGAR